MTAKKLREKLAQGKTVTMINPHHNHSGLVQRLIEAGADAVFLDCEHGPWSHEDVRQSANAARMAGGSGIVRPHSHERPVLIRYLNQGADGLMVPMVENADQARAIVDAMEYAYPDDPRGRFLIIMLESMNAIDNLDEMLKVDGIDVFFVGPTDLTQSMGLIPAPGPRPKEVVEAIENVFKKVNDAGKVAGVLTNAGDIEFWASKGGRYLYIHADPFLKDGMKKIHALIESGSAKIA